MLGQLEPGIFLILLYTLSAVNVCLFLRRKEVMRMNLACREEDGVDDGWLVGGVKEMKDGMNK